MTCQRGSPVGQVASRAWHAVAGRSASAPDAASRVEATDARALLEGEVGVWLVRLDLAPETVARLARLLGEDERRRAARFHSRPDARSFIVGRAALRKILGDCLGVDARAVHFAVGARGKPELAGPFQGTAVRFNASRSGTLGLYAVTRVGRVGVDIECRRPLPDLEAIAGWVFSPREREGLRALPSARRAEGFLNCWTRKEAYVKAIGEGLSYPLERFTVSLAPGAAARLEHVEDDPAEAERWTVVAFDPDPDHVAAVVVEGRPSRLVRHTWEGPWA
jgi:4'-phosphopantetheinyl transferase